MKKKKWKVVLGALFIVVGITSISSVPLGGLFWLVVGCLMIRSYLKQPKEEPTSAYIPAAKIANSQAQPRPQKLPAVPDLDRDNLKSHQIIVSEKNRPRRTKFPEISYSNVTKTIKLKEFVVVDTETTGVSPFKDRIVELAAVRFVDGKPVETFQTLVDPGIKIPPEASRVNHITDTMVEESPKIGFVLDSFEEFVGDSIIVGHNLPFDLKCLYYSGSRITDSEKRKYIDTLAQSRRFLSTPKRRLVNGHYEYDYDSDYDVENRKLQTILEYYGINPGSAHRALDDAIATGYVLLEFHRQRLEAV